MGSDRFLCPYCQRVLPGYFVPLGNFDILAPEFDALRGVRSNHKLGAFERRSSVFSVLTVDPD